MVKKDLNISISESARLGQAINLAMQYKLSMLEEGSSKPQPEEIERLVFEYTYPLIERIRQEYVKRRDKINEVLSDTEQQMYDGCMSDSGQEKPKPKPKPEQETKQETKVVL